MIFDMRKKKEDGNARTTAVFFLKYFRVCSFDARNDIFVGSGWNFIMLLFEKMIYNDKKYEFLWIY